MPDYPSSRSRFLNEEESILACNRLSADGIGLTQGRGVERIPHWVAFKMTVSDWRVWAQCFMFILVTGFQTMQYFIPTLVGSFGWTGVQGQCKLCSQTMQCFVPTAITDKDRPHDPCIHGSSGIRRRVLLSGGQIQSKVAIRLRPLWTRLCTIHRCYHGHKQDDAVCPDDLRVWYHLRLLAFGEDLGLRCYSTASC
jgi:hypothetical protein